MAGATITLFLIHGDAKRLRTAELSNWTGKAVAGPRSEIEAILAREEATKSGVYFLIGTDPDSGNTALYVGEAESIKHRLRSHFDTEFWNHIVFFISKDENLTKAHIRYLEGRLIAQAREAARAVLKNGQSSGARLPESDREDMEVFLDRMHQLMPVLGVDALSPVAVVPEGLAERQELSCEIKGLKAVGHLSPGGLVGREGSQAVLKDRDSAAPWAVAMRKRLVEDGTLIEKDGFLVFTRDTEFSSASAAATVIHGGNANGLLAWKDSDGRTLKQLEQQRSAL